MKPIRMFMFETCPHCQRAMAWMNECRQENADYAKIVVEMIDEKRQPEIASEYDYYYVPCFFIDKTKLHEGAASKEIIRNVFDAALKA